MLSQDSEHSLQAYGFIRILLHLRIRNTEKAAYYTDCVTRTRTPQLGGMAGATSPGPSGSSAADVSESTLSDSESSASASASATAMSASERESCSVV